MDEHRADILSKFRQQLEFDFLAADEFDSEAEFVLPEEEYQNEKLSFLKSWFTEYPIFAKTNKNIPDSEQLSAIASVHDHTKVTARAGSGKTTTLVNRVRFLIEHCRVNPSEILILAFNKNAVEDIQDSLLKLNPNVYGDARFQNRDLEQHPPHVMTFHALAYAISGRGKDLLYDDKRFENQRLSMEIQRVIDDHLHSPVTMPLIRELMLSHFREDWVRIIEGRYDKTPQELIQFRRSLPREGINGEYVKSYGEKVIVDFLFEHGIAYKYEHSHWWNGVNYRPDFTVFKSNDTGIVIEYFGLEGDPDYDNMTKEKRRYWAQKSGWHLIEVHPINNLNQTAKKTLSFIKQHLENQGIQCIRRSEEDIWNHIRKRAIDRFTNVTEMFISRCQKYLITPIKLRDLIDTDQPQTKAESIFWELIPSLYEGYLERLVSTNQVDFDGLLQRSADLVRSGKSAFIRKQNQVDLKSLRFICIDEFQDFSPLFYNLVDAIRSKNPTANLFCIGDDWQAINGFAGSDLRFFSDFGCYFESSNEIEIRKNYRSTEPIVEVGNRLMSGLGNPAVPERKTQGTIRIVYLDDFQPTPVELERHSYDKITPTVLRIIRSALKQAGEIVMLCRRNKLLWNVNYPGRSNTMDDGLSRFLEHIRSYFPSDQHHRIEISTVHRYKGLENQTVIVLDVVFRNYPLVHPNWFFSRILGVDVKKLIDEEQRLLYVALTRAKDSLYVITEDRSKSPFIETFESSRYVDSLEWEDYPPAKTSVTSYSIRIFNQSRRGSSPTYNISDRR